MSPVLDILHSFSAGCSPFFSAPPTALGVRALWPASFWLPSGGAEAGALPLPTSSSVLSGQLLDIRSYMAEVLPGSRRSGLQATGGLSASLGPRARTEWPWGRGEGRKSSDHRRGRGCSEEQGWLQPGEWISNERLKGKKEERNQGQGGKGREILAEEVEGGR